MTSVTVSDVSVSDTNGDGSGDAILAFPRGKSITLAGVITSQLNDPTALAAMGIPAALGAPNLDYIVSGTDAGEVINEGYSGDPDGDMVDNNDDSDGSNNDSIRAGGADDTVASGLGNDTLWGQDGNDTLDGGDGDETNGDTLDLSAVTTTTTIDLTNANPETGAVSDGIYTASFIEIENISLGSGGDTIFLADGSGQMQLTPLT